MALQIFTDFQKWMGRFLHDGSIGMIKQSVAPATPPANQLTIYPLDAAGLTELYYKNSAGTQRDLSLVSTIANYLPLAGGVMTGAITLSGIQLGTYTLGGTPTLPLISSAAYPATTSAQLAGVISDETGSGLLVFGTSPTIVTPVITQIVPGANFSLSQNGVTPFVSEQTGAVANTIYLKAGNVGFGTANPTEIFHLKASNKYILLENTSSAEFGLNLASPSGVKAVYLLNDSTGEVRIGATAAGGYFSTFFSNGAEAMRINTEGNVKITGTAVRATTEGTKHLDIFNGIVPVGTLANGISLYSTAGEAGLMDAAGHSIIFKAHTANGLVATVLGSVGPTGANTVVQEWLTISLDGNTRYIPCF